MERETERQRGRGLEHLRTLPQPGWPRAHSPSSIPPLTREALPSQAPLCDYLAQGSGILILTSECLPPLRLTQAWGWGVAGEADESKTQDRAGHGSHGEGTAHLPEAGSDKKGA